MSEQTVVRSGGISFLGLLAIVFIGLKLAGIGVVATWSWWWVTLPLWIGPAILAGFGLVALVIWLIVKLIGLAK